MYYMKDETLADDGFHLNILEKIRFKQDRKVSK